jgi:hypothetical protein
MEPNNYKEAVTLINELCTYCVSKVQTNTVSNTARDNDNRKRGNSLENEKNATWKSDDSQLSKLDSKFVRVIASAREPPLSPRMSISNSTEFEDLEYKGESHTLSPRDWNLLLGNSHESSALIYNQNEIILKQGKEYRGVFQIIKGSCRIEVNGKVVGKLYEDETFGDVSIIQGGVASASVIADEDEVTLITIDGNYLTCLFYSFPTLAMK